MPPCKSKPEAVRFKRVPARAWSGEPLEAPPGGRSSTTSGPRIQHDRAIFVFLTAEGLALDFWMTSAIGKRTSTAG